MITTYMIYIYDNNKERKNISFEHQWEHIFVLVKENTVLQADGTLQKLYEDSKFTLESLFPYVPVLPKYTCKLTESLFIHKCEQVLYRK